MFLLPEFVKNNLPKLTTSRLHESESEWQGNECKECATWDKDNLSSAKNLEWMQLNSKLDFILTDTNNKFDKIFHKVNSFNSKF